MVETHKISPILVEISTNLLRYIYIYIYIHIYIHISSEISPNLWILTTWLNKQYESWQGVEDENGESLAGSIQSDIRQWKLPIDPPIRLCDLDANPPHSSDWVGFGSGGFGSDRFLRSMSRSIESEVQSYSYLIATFTSSARIDTKLKGDMK